MTSRDKTLVVSMIVVACGFLLLPFILHTRSTAPGPALDLVARVSRSSSLPAPTGDARAAFVDSTAPIEVPAPPAPTPSKPFQTDPAILAAVVDGHMGGSEELLANRVAVDYLFHRWLAGPDEYVPRLARLPDWQTFADVAPQLRGQRYRMYLTLVGEPVHFTGLLPGGGESGVDRYWDVFGRDVDGHMHRVVFVRKHGTFFDGEAVEMDVDFLRIHEFVQHDGKRASVPQWSALELEPFVAESPLVGWDPVYWVILLCFGGLLVAGSILGRQAVFGRFEQRRLRARQRAAVAKARAVAGTSDGPSSGSTAASES
ncbi:MAG: hypothetical protein AB7I09_08255 [Planctomycetota bacterium]